MDGIATLTMVTSSKIMNAPTSTTASEIQRLGSASAEACVGALIAHLRSLRQSRQHLVVPSDFGFEAQYLMPEAEPLDVVEVRVGLLLEAPPLGHLGGVGLAPVGDHGPGRLRRQVVEVLQREIDRIVGELGAAQRLVP